MGLIVYGSGSALTAVAPQLWVLTLGWVTTYLSWRLVFAGEVVLVLAILATSRWIREARMAAARPKRDYLGAVLSVAAWRWRPRGAAFR